MSFRRHLLFAVLLLATGIDVLAQPFVFELRRTDLATAVYGRLVPADLDSDGDIDLVISGAPGVDADAPLTLIAGSGEGPRPDLQITYSSLSLDTPTWLGDGAVADANRDGFPDLLLTGSPSTMVAAVGEPAEALTQLYLGNGDGTFRRANAGLPDVYAGMVAWADFDNDADPDVLIAGIDPSGVVTTDVYRNDGTGNFEASGSQLPQLAMGDAAWADVDGDGDMDLALSGLDGDGGFHSVIVTNDGGILSVKQLLEPLAYSSVAWGDYDADGDPDLLLTGARLSRIDQLSGVSKLYRNENGVLTAVEARIPGVLYGAGAWGDFDQDGDLDLAVSGLRTLTDVPIAVVLENTGGAFNTHSVLPGSYGGSLVWSDVDDDHDLDLLISGQDAAAVGFVRVVANVSRIANHPPDAPAGLASTVQGRNVTLSWQPAGDAASPTPLLTYNLRIGTSPGGSEVLPSLAAAGGRRFLTAPGNVGQSVQWTLRNLPQGSYTWSVQALDASYRGSDFAPEAAFSVAGGKGGSTADEDLDLPGSFAVSSPYPNPFDSETRIGIDVPGVTEVRVTVFDVRGRRVTLLRDGVLPPGRHELAWGGAAEGGHDVAPGVYLLEIVAGSHRETRLVVRTAR